MQIDHDVLMLIIGAAIGLSSSLLTSIFQAWLNKREFHRQKEYEKRAELKRIILPTTSEIQEYSKSPIKAEPTLKDSLDVVIRRQSLFDFLRLFFENIRVRASEYSRTRFDEFFFIILVVAMILDYLFYRLIVFALNTSPLLLSFIAGVGAFVVMHFVTKPIRKNLKIRFMPVTESKNGNYLCTECDLPFKSKEETYAHIRRWHENKIKPL